MDPVEFYEGIVLPNMEDLRIDRGSMRAAVNIALSIDAFMGVLALSRGCEDTTVRDELISIEPEYEIARDLAFSLKHGGLTRPSKTPRLVSRADHISVAEGAFDPDVFDQAGFEVDCVEIEVTFPDGEKSTDKFAADTLFEKVVTAAVKLLPEPAAVME